MSGDRESTLYVMPVGEDGRVTIPESGCWTLSWRGGTDVVFGEVRPSGPARTPGSVEET